MKQIFKCDLPKFSNFKTDKTPDYVKDSCSRRDFCFPHGTKEFCQPPFCEKDFTENRRACSHSPSSVCPGPGELIEEANAVCKKKEFIAIKTIRMTLIQEFIPYFRDDTNDLDPFFIFLVRDPRGLMNSRLRIARVQYHEKDEKKFHEIASKVEGKKNSRISESKNWNLNQLEAFALLLASISWQNSIQVTASEWFRMSLQ